LTGSTVGCTVINNMSTAQHVTVELDLADLEPVGRTDHGLIFETTDHYCVVYQIHYREDGRTPGTVWALWWQEGRGGPIERTRGEHTAEVTASRDELVIEWAPAKVPRSVENLVLERVSAECWHLAR
jgi:hypothetical protein